MSDFQFVDLPKPQRGRTSGSFTQDALLNEFAAALKARPGEWAIWPKETTWRAAKRKADHINRPGQYTAVAFKGGDFKARVLDGVLYVRYVGEAHP